MGRANDFYSRTSLWAACAAALHLLVVVFLFTFRPHQRAALASARVFAEAEDLRRRGRISEAVTRYEEIAERYHASPTAPAALYELALHDLLDLGDLNSGLRRLTTIRGEFPGYPEAQKARVDMEFIERFAGSDSFPVREFYLALGLLRGGRSQSGFDALLKITSYYPGHPIEPEVLYHALRASRTLGRPDADFRLAERYSRYAAHRPYYRAIP